MLHVVPHVEGEEVPDPVVGVSLVTLCVHVVLGNEVGGHGVETHGEEGPHDEVEEGPPPKETHDQRVKHHLDCHVEQLQPRGRLWAHDEGAKAVEEGL